MHGVTGRGWKWLSRNHSHLQTFPAEQQHVKHMFHNMKVIWFLSFLQHKGLFCTWTWPEFSFVSLHWNLFVSFRLQKGLSSTAMMQLCLVRRLLECPGISPTKIRIKLCEHSPCYLCASMSQQRRQDLPRWITARWNRSWCGSCQEQCPNPEKMQSKPSSNSGLKSGNCAQRWSAAVHINVKISCSPSA